MMRGVILVSLPFALIACGGSSGSGTPTGPIEVQLLASGASPKSFVALSGGKLHFTNKDTVDHQVASADCPEISSPRLTPNADFTATLGSGPKTCDFDDALNPTNVAFQGTVTVNAPGAGY
jgi:hypothetical protein